MVAYDPELLIWTDDNWKLAGALAVSYNKSMSYIMVEHNEAKYLVAEKRLGEFIARVGGGKQSSFKTIMVLDGA